MLLVGSLLAPLPAQTLPGQIIRDPAHPQWLMRDGGSHVFLCGAGDQDALIDKLVAEGGEDFTLTLTNALASTFVYNVVGFSFLGALFEGGTFVPSLNVIVPGFTNASGVEVIQTLFPAGFPSGASAYIQCWMEDPAAVFGWAGSNAVQGIGP